MLNTWIKGHCAANQALLSNNGHLGQLHNELVMLGQLHNELVMLGQLHNELVMLG